MKRSTLINVLGITGLGVAAIVGLGLFLNKKESLNNIEDSYYFVEENDNEIVNS
jgi:hypothetical protein